MNEYLETETSDSSSDKNSMIEQMNYDRNVHFLNEDITKKKNDRAGNVFIATTITLTTAAILYSLNKHGITHPVFTVAGGIAGLTTGKYFAEAISDTFNIKSKETELEQLVEQAPITKQN